MILAALAVLAFVALAGCKSSSDAASELPRPSREFCRAAARYDQRVQMAKLPEQIELVSNIAEHAPVDIERDVNTFLDALKRRESGDDSVVDDPRIETAVDNVNRRAGQDCGWYKREGI